MSDNGVRIFVGEQVINKEMLKSVKESLKMREKLYFCKLIRDNSPCI